MMSAFAVMLSMMQLSELLGFAYTALIWRREKL